MNNLTGYTFRPKARLLLQLGDQLIRNEAIAIIELVKNSYDADASEVFVKIQGTANDNMSILIEDNGSGMDMGIIKNVWLEPGSDYKSSKYSKKSLTPKYNRLPIGEKGIGRFGAHKLGETLQIITRQAGKDEIVITLDWKALESSKYLDDADFIKIIERKPEIFTEEKTGTRITIHNLKSDWDKPTIQKLYRSLQNLNSPFQKEINFKVNFEIENKEWIDSLLSWEDIVNFALFRVEAEIENNRISKFSYKFQPWETMDKLTPRSINEKDISILRMVKGKEQKEINLSNFKIGKFKINLLIFDRDNRVLNMGVNDKTGLKDYLDENGGIKVFRDNLRVYDYGEPGNDWLGLDTRRINIPGVRISNNITIGAINLSGESSSDLKEKTNREGFIENAAYKEFIDAIGYLIHIVETQRRPDKEKMRLHYGPTRKSEPVISQLEELTELIEHKVENESLKKEIQKSLIRISNDYKEINKILLKSANAGLNLSVVVHEVEKITDELKATVLTETTSNKIQVLVKHLGELIDGYSSLIRTNNKIDIRPKELIEQSLFNVEYRLKVHNIDIQFGDINNTLVSCSKNLIVGVIMNIIDNSIWWLDYVKQKDTKKIFIATTKRISGFNSIIIADNGNGFTLPTEQITQPFVSGKPYGMGLGLHISDEIMKLNEGILYFPTLDDVSVPKEFEKGAIVAICFKTQK